MHISLRACVKCPLVHVLGWIAAAAPAALKAFWQEAPRNTTITIDNRSSVLFLDLHSFYSFPPQPHPLSLQPRILLVYWYIPDNP